MSDHFIAQIEPRRRVRVVWRAAETVELAEGETVTLRLPDRTLDALAYGPLDPAFAISPRVAPQTIGHGRVEAIPAQDILPHADPEDADGDGNLGPRRGRPAAGTPTRHAGRVRHARDDAA